jgi:chromosome partitioning protein
MKIISISSQKGGVGKTTITQNLAIALANKGKKVGLIDLDSQGNLSSSFTLTLTKPTLSELIKAKIKIDDSVWSQTTIKNLELILNDGLLLASDFGKGTNQLFCLKNLWATTKFDFVLIDTPPNLDTECINAFILSNWVLIPITYQKFSIHGLKSVIETIEEIKENTNKELQTLGIVANMVNKQFSSYNIEAKAAIKENYPSSLLSSEISQNSKLWQSQLNNSNIFEKLFKSRSDDFEQLAKEVIKLTN